MHKIFFFLLLACGGNTFSQSPDFDKLPTLAWQFKAGPIVSSPVMDGDLVYFGSLDRSLYALETKTGILKWKYPTSGVIRSTVCLENDNLFLYSGNGVLYCLNKKSGKQNWKFQTATGYLGDRHNDFADYYHSSPIVQNGIVYFGSGDGYVYAVKTSNGELIWNYKTDDVVHTKPFLHHNRLFIGSFDGYLYALNAQTGALHWKFKSTGQRYFPKGEIMGNPVVAKGLVLVGSRDFNFYAIDENSGYCHWIKTFPRGWALPVTPNDSVIYLGTSDDRQLFSVDIASGKVHWKADANFNIFGGTALGKAMGYFGTLKGQLVGIELKTGAVKWQFTNDASRTHQAKYFKENGDYRDDIGQLLPFPEDQLTMYQQLGAIFSTPALSNDLLVITCFDGTVYALKK